MVCISPNPRRVGYIDPIHVPLGGPLYMGSHIHQYLYQRVMFISYGAFSYFHQG